MEDEGRRIAERAIRYRGQLAGIMVAGLLEIFTPACDTLATPHWAGLTDD